MPLVPDKFMRPAKRFEILSKETNIGSFNFGSDSGSEILNIDHSPVDQISEDLKEMFDAAKENVIDPVMEAKDDLEELIRDSQSQLNNVVDFAKAAPGKVSEWVGGITGSSPSTNKAFTDFLSKCKTKGSGLGYGGRPYMPKISCNGKSVGVGKQSGGAGKCNAANFDSVLNKITGAGDGAFKNAQAALNALMSLANTGYSFGLCGVFGALKGSDIFGSSVLNNDMLGKAAGGLMSAMNLSKNVPGWIDVATSSIGLDPKINYLDTVSDFFKNYELPSTLPAVEMPSLADMTFAATDAVEPDWFSRGAGSFMTLGPAYAPSDDAKDVFSCKLTEKAYGEDQLDSYSDSDFDYMLAAGISV